MVPEEFIYVAIRMAPEEDRISVGDMFKKEIEDAKVPGSPAAKRQEEIADLIMEALIRGDHMIDL